MRSEQPIATLDDLRHYVHETLCEYTGLAHGAFPLAEQMLVQAGRACGMFFCLQGPRAVKLSAVWSAPAEQVLFYDSAGRRFHRETLESGMLARELAAV